MAELLKKQVTLIIGGRSYPAQIDPAEESSLQDVLNELNRRVATFTEKYPTKDKQDILAMTLLTYASEMHQLQHHSQQAATLQIMAEKMAGVRRLLDEVLE
jgi:cell division protein ZapA (FtsZ GTPase activity inhibitor)